MDASARALAVRAACLYVPVAAVALSWWWRRPVRRVVGAAILGTAWALPTLLVLDKVAPVVGWWHFAARGGVVAGMPADLWIGWALLWGALPVMFDGSRRRVLAAVVGFAALDVVAMPRLRPTVVLGSVWVVGEAVAIAVVLVPALALSRWTARDDQLR